MTTVETLFVTKLYRSELNGAGARRFLEELDATSRAIAAEDTAGQRWCAQHAYPGYTSYASLDDLPLRAPVYAELEKRIDEHVASFAADLEFDLSGRSLHLDSLWINVLAPGGHHASHIHPHSVISGTLYVTVPKGASAIKFEDPRLPLMMAAPPRKVRAGTQARSFWQVSPKPGTLLLWESWLRHEVLVNEATQERISVSFNYR